MIPEISFIYVNYRSAVFLERSLASVRSSVDGQVSTEYIIINNDRTERERINQLTMQYPDLHIVHQEHNIGFGQANNIGGRLATGEVLFFINPDTVWQQGNPRGLLAAFRFRPQALFGMALTDASGVREIWSAGAFPTLARILWANVFPKLLNRPWQAQWVTQTDWVSGAALAIRRDFFQTLQGFDTDYFLYFEDVDLAHRAIVQGGWVGVYPFIQLQHMGGRSHENLAMKKNAYYMSQRRYFEKWRPKLEEKILIFGQTVRRFLI